MTVFTRWGEVGGVIADEVDFVRRGLVEAILTGQVSGSVEGYLVETGMGS